MTLPALILLSTMTVTSYRAIPSQTDSSPSYTSINHHVHPYGVAVSRDLLASQTVCYGDAIVIPGLGVRIVNDTMHSRIKQSVDIFVETHKEEKKIGTRKLTITVLRSETRKCSRDEYLTQRSYNNFR